MIVDLNADLGEGCGNDRALLQLVSSANIACGFHAGDAQTMRQSVRWALEFGVAIGWQWGASTGTDAAPYFRIFNPTTQGERFDKQGRFIKHWLPELAEVPDKDIHQPHRWADKQRRVLNYPAPIIDHAIARKETLAAFEAAKNRAQSDG